MRGLTLQMAIKPFTDFPGPSSGCQLVFGHFSANTTSSTTDTYQQNAKELVGMKERQCLVKHWSCPRNSGNSTRRIRAQIKASASSIQRAGENHSETEYGAEDSHPDHL